MREFNLVLYSVCGAWFLFLSTGQFKLLDVTVLWGQPEGGEGCCVLYLVIVELEVKRFGPRVMHSLCFYGLKAEKAFGKRAFWNFFPFTSRGVASMHNPDLMHLGHLKHLLGY